jgi:conjugal transfer mating pair stabilization protein TraN
MTSPAKSSQAMSCNSNLFNSDQFIAPPNPNSSFGKAAVAMEIARQTQVYADCSSGDPAACLNAAIFVGTPEKCTKGYAGLRNCCNSSPGAQSNSDLMSTIGFGVGGKVAMFAGEKAVDAASPYVFDAMYSGATYVGGLTNSMSTVTSMLGSSAPAGTSLASGGVSAYGLTYGSTTAFAGGGLGGGNIALTGGALAETTSTAAAAAATTAGETASLAMSANAAATAAEATAMATGAAADMAAATIAQNAAFAAAETAATAATASTAAAAGAAEAASSVLMFNPYTFAIAIAITLITTYIMSLMSCTKEEQVLAMHKGANLSVFTGQSCTKKLPAIGTCMEYTDTYCSFNSVLAKLINQQGKAQLDLNFASCTGLTVAQISKLDFSKINLSEFVNTMVAKATSNLPTSVPTNYAPLVQNTTTGSAQSGSNGTGYPVGYKP